MIKAFCLVILLAVQVTSLYAADSKPQVILLKLDDVVARRTGTSPVSPRWQRMADYLEANQIKGAFGIITESLEKDDDAYFQWIKKLQAGGLIEFWHHGYKMRGPNDRGEFEAWHRG
jgi:hypothetical protein